MIIILLALLFYFVPAVIAWKRHHHNLLAIVMLNVFLGWTFLGWVAAFVWACTKVTLPPVTPSNPLQALDKPSVKTLSRPISLKLSQPVVSGEHFNFKTQTWEETFVGQ